MSLDPYVYPGTTTLVNKYNLRNQAKAQKLEDINSAIRIKQLKTKPINGSFDLDHLKKIHQHIFKDSYKWAGEIRTINISKDESQFAFAQYIKPASKKVFKDLKNDNHLKGQSRKEFVGKASYYYSEITTLFILLEKETAEHNKYL